MPKDSPACGEKKRKQQRREKTDKVTQSAIKYDKDMQIKYIQYYLLEESRFPQKPATVFPLLLVART